MRRVKISGSYHSYHFNDILFFRSCFVFFVHSEMDVVTRAEEEDSRSGHGTLEKVKSLDEVRIAFFTIRYDKSVIPVMCNQKANILSVNF
jgi:hypothetical protein